MAAAPHPALALLYELEVRDDALGAALGEIVRLERDADEVGERAGRVAAFLAVAPAETERLAATLAAAELAAGAAEQAHAAADLAARDAEASDGKEAASLRHAADLAADRLRSARDTTGRARVAREHHLAEVEAARLEAPLIEERAATLAAGLADLPGLSRSAALPPAAGLAGVVEWRSRARAGLLVVRATLVREREALLREATETAAVVSAAVVAGPGVAGVRTQLERTLA